MRIFLSACFLLTLYSCDNYRASDPAFFWICNKASVTVQPNQGSSSNKITDIFLYVNDNFQGIYPVGKMMPVVTNGQPVHVAFYAGIKNNGITNTRLDWIFYDQIAVDTAVPNGKVIERDLSFRYNSAITFTWVESFDDPTGLSLRKALFSDTTFKFADPSNCFEKRSIELGLTGQGKVALIESATQFELPKNTPNVYLELNHKGNEILEVGLKGDDGQLRDVLIITPKEDWDKIYISLADAANREPVSKTFRVYFRLIKLDDNPEPKVFLDNIKLMFIK
jgi:hypothetical protein